MKSQAAVVLVALFLLTALTTNADCFSGTVPGRTRQLEKKVCAASEPFTRAVLLNVTGYSWRNYQMLF